MNYLNRNIPAIERRLETLLYQTEVCNNILNGKDKNFNGSKTVISKKLNAILGEIISLDVRRDEIKREEQERSYMRFNSHQSNDNETPEEFSAKVSEWVKRNN